MAQNRELQALVSIAGQLDPSLQRSINQASSSFKGVKTAAAAASAAVVAGMAAATAATVKAVSSAMDYEKSFAQTSTLLQGTSQELKAYSDAIIDMSNETGVAATDLTDAVYNALSAGVDQAHALEFTSTAIKLAEGGFTDATTAVDVLTTALNAYGLEADQAGKISDYLIVTQNLGKTTVDELASSVGKVIPIASAYGVEMDNLSAAYAQLTAGGIATAEAGTTLKAMLNELGDSGSEVSKVLVKQTGMSFGQLTESGKSLGDIMAILGDSVGGNAGKFNELWSSSEAGVGALSIMNSGAEAYNKTLAAMQNSAGETDKAYDTMTDTLDHQIQVIKNLGKNFFISVGQEVLPIVRDLAEKAIPKIEEAIKTLMPIFSSMGKAMVSIMSNLGKVLFPFVVNAIEWMADVAEAAVPFVTAVADTLGSTFGAVGDAFSGAFGYVKSFFDFLSKHQTILKMVAIGVGTLTTAIIAYTVAQHAAAIANAVETAAIWVYCTATSVATAITSAFGTVVAFLTSPITLVIGAIGLLVAAGVWLADNWEWVKGKASELWSAMCSVAKGIADVFAAAFNGLVGIIKAPFNAIISIVNGVIDAINGIGFTIPDWVPVIGGSRFALDIPKIPMLAAGGFTEGVSIAGEAGTEAVISFDPAYRDENLSYWAQAGRMLGMNDAVIDSLVSGSSGGGGVANASFTFAPKVTINGNCSKEDIMAALREEEEEFVDMIEDMLSRRGGGSYAYG